MQLKYGVQFIYITLFLILFRINTFGQVVNDSLKSDATYYSEQLKNHYIIELNSEPVNFNSIEKTCRKKYRTNSGNFKSYRKKLINDGQKIIDSEQSDFLEGFNKIDQKSANPDNYKKKLLRQYKCVFNGFAVEADSLTIRKIKTLPHVKRVVRDRIIRISDATSNTIIGAPQVWQKTGATGKNIKIGILDTGVDPDHPDLKGRVLTGYDFVNNDTVAFDDNKHGTHVAGIAAANGTSLKGVAPDALIVPIKVLDASGSGSFSNIIAGVNYAADPDNNPLTDDGVKILSISLGGPGSPDDPLAQAINHAFEKNVLCVVAAGNSGNNFYTIGTPGCAAKALTVGATDSNDNLAPFSSCGPILGTFQVKPEVLAPGVDIFSTVPGGGYSTLSGTSMATPHVSGAAALLMELHPDWTPADVKAALMQASKDVGLTIWKQGNGRMDVLKATQVTAAVSPSIISFGNVGDTVLFSKTQALSIHILSGGAKNYNCTLMDTLPDGIMLSFPPAITVTDSISIPVSLSMNLNTYHFLNTVPSFYKNKLLLVSNADTLSIPFVVNKVSIFKMKFDQIPDAVFILSGINFPSEYYPTDTVFTSIIDNPGIYDVIACFDGFNTLVVRENETLASNTIVSIKKSEAKNEITIGGVDQNGVNIPIYYGNTESLSVGDPYFGMRLIRITAFTDDYTTKVLTKRISDLPAKYRWDFETLSIPPWNASKKFYFFPFEFANGINANQVITNSKEEFIKIDRKFPQRFSNSNTQLVHFRFSQSIGGGGFINKDWAGLDKNNVFTDYVLPLPSREYKLSKYSSSYYLKNQQDSTVFATGDEVCLSKNSISIGNEWFGKSTSIAGSKVSLKYGILPTHYYPMFYYSGNQIIIDNKSPSFQNSNFEMFAGKINFRILYKGGKDSVGSIYNDRMFSATTSDWGKFHYPINSDFEKIRFSFSAGELDTFKCISTAAHFPRFPIVFGSRPLAVNSFQIKESGITTDHMRKGHTNSVELQLQEGFPLDSIDILIKPVQDTVWKSVKLSPDPVIINFWKGIFPDSLKPGYYDIKAILTNQYDSLVYTVNPAFLFYSDSCDPADTSAVYPNVTINSSDPDNKVCFGENISLTAGGAYRYIWSTNEETPRIIAGSSGKYAVVGINLFGCRDTVSIDVHVNPVYNSNQNITICDGESYHGHSVSGIYTENLISLSGCDSIITTNLTVNPLPVISVNSASICIGETVTLSASGASAYSWNTGGTTSGIIVSPTITITYSVTGTKNNCSATSSVTVVVNPIPVIAINPTEVTICQGNSAMLSANGASAYLWSTGATTSNITVTPAATTTCSVTGTTNNCSATSSATFIVNPLPAVIVIPQSSTINPGNSATLTASGALTYLWSANASNATTASVLVAPTVTTTYTVTGTDSLGCSSTALTIVIYTNPTSMFENNNTYSFSIYPNPTTGHFIIVSGKSIVKANVTITNILGENILSQELRNNTTEIDLSNQANGIYFLQFRTEHGITPKKIVLSK